MATLTELYPLNKQERLRLQHDPEDPSTWKLLRQHRGWLGWKTTTTQWFLTRAQAEAEIARMVKQGRSRDLVPQLS